ncbi:MAG: hypothetical protein CMA45_02565 [Euryarchaeota archaeon]|nr:hypothetical protein [Euryarchaeota archaeon]
MVQWDLDFGQKTELQRPQKSSRRIKAKRTPTTRKTSSRPLVEPELNSHLLHAGRSNKVTKNGKKLRIRRVAKASKANFKQPNFSIE